MSDYGPERLMRDLTRLGYTVTTAVGTDRSPFLVLPQFEVPAGKFTGRIIDLGLHATADFPNSVHSSIHVRADPQLYEICNIAGVRNVVASVLGADWRYWSKNFNWSSESEKTARRYMAKITTIFENA
jgi:hypothetical protein